MILILSNKLLPNYLVIGDTGTTKIIEEQERRSQSETQTLSPSTSNLAHKSGTTISKEEENKHVAAMTQI